jgi:exopolysaccharide production protein ExoZ
MTQRSTEDLSKPTRLSEIERGGSFQSIQALRGIAAVMVTIFHAGLRFDQSEMTFRIGNAGVDIFFIISGFVMWTVTARRPDGPFAFLRRRFVRLVPLYWLWTIMAIAAWAVIPSAFPRMHPTVGHVALSLAFVPHTSPEGARISPVLGQGWTLNFEVFFYVLFAAALILPSRTRFGFMVALLLLLPLARHIVEVPAATLLSPLLVEFLGGIILARLVIGGLRPDALRCWACVAVGVVLLLFAAPAADDDLARLFQYGVPAFLIVGGAVGAELTGSLSVRKLPRWLGDASYSIYLTHAFFISALGKLWPIGLAPWIFLFSATTLALLLGLAAYVLIERPLLALLRAGRSSPPNDQPFGSRWSAHRILVWAITAVSGH